MSPTGSGSFCETAVLTSNMLFVATNVDSCMLCGWRLCGLLGLAYSAALSCSYVCQHISVTGTSGGLMLRVLTWCFGFC
jgi:hypothetical protein